MLGWKIIPKSQAIASSNNKSQAIASSNNFRPQNCLTGNTDVLLKVKRILVHQMKYGPTLKRIIFSYNPRMELVSTKKIQKENGNWVDFEDVQVGDLVWINVSQLQADGSLYVEKQYEGTSRRIPKT